MSPTNIMKRILADLPSSKHAKGFITLDIVMAIGIIATLTALTVPSLFAALDTAKRQALLEEIRNIRGSLLNFFAHTRRLPKYDPGENFVGFINGAKRSSIGGTSGLVRNTEGLSGWNGPYIEKQVLSNPLGGTYFLDYTLKLDTRGDDRVRSVDPVLRITNIKKDIQRYIDYALDDGIPYSGIVQVVNPHSRVPSLEYNESDDVIIVLFEDIEIDPLTGR